FFFFFQAEDGIRDFHVTGVQTCALPISETLQAALSDRLAVPSRLVGRAVLVEAEAPAALLPRVYEACAALIEQATVRKPTLEDVFMATTGRAWSDGRGQRSEVREREARD